MYVVLLMYEVTLHLLVCLSHSLSRSHTLTHHLAMAARSSVSPALDTGLEFLKKERVEPFVKWVLAETPRTARLRIAPDALALILSFAHDVFRTTHALACAKFPHTAVAPPLADVLASDFLQWCQEQPQDWCTTFDGALSEAESVVGVPATAAPSPKK